MHWLPLIFWILAPLAGIADYVRAVRSHKMVWGAHSLPNGSGHGYRTTPTMVDIEIDAPEGVKRAARLTLLYAAMQAPLLWLVKTLSDGSLTWQLFAVVHSALAIRAMLSGRKLVRNAPGASAHVRSTTMALSSVSSVLMLLCLLADYLPGGHPYNQNLQLLVLIGSSLGLGLCKYLNSASASVDIHTEQLAVAQAMTEMHSEKRRVAPMPIVDDRPLLGIAYDEETAALAQEQLDEREASQRQL